MACPTHASPCMRRSGSIGRTELVFFANWQTQVARLLARCTTDPKASSHLSAYIYHLHDTILDKLKLYEAVKRVGGAGGWGVMQLLRRD